MIDQSINKKMLYLVSQDKELYNALLGTWDPDNVVVFDTAASAMEYLLIDPPEMLLVDYTLPDMSGLELLRLVKEENVYRQLSTLLYVNNFDIMNNIEWNNLDVDDFVTPPLNSDVLKARIELGIQRSSRTLDASPLTHLPGNTSIINTIKERIQKSEDFALGYCDLDYFKSYNDKYGFSRGDEVLMMTSRLVVTTVRSFKLKNSFVGHIGGDDFVFIMPSKYVELACEHIIASFDAIIPQFYDAQDREQKGITSIDRQGILRRFPFMSISIAVVVNKDGALEHYGQVSQIASSLKSQVKALSGSNFIIDRRPIII